jgi:sugar phosphate isomerase/epimerase
MTFDSVIVSQCTYPDAPLAVTLPLFREMGFRKVEAFTDWAASRLDHTVDPQQYLTLAAEHGLCFHTLHLPALSNGSMDDLASLGKVLEAIDFAGRMGMHAVYLRSRTADALVRDSRTLLDACAAAGVQPLLEPHDHAPAHNTQSTLELLNRIDDARLKVVLELGHLGRAGDDWQDFCRAMGGTSNTGGRIASVHLKNLSADGRWAPWRTGVIDIPEVVRQLALDGFGGDIVLETELGDRERTDRDLADLRDWLRQELA